jgi:multidrug transporter EmrE-like cation transporter
MSATLFSVLLFGEELGIVKIIGIIVILIAVALLGREKE